MFPLRFGWVFRISGVLQDNVEPPAMTSAPLSKATLGSPSTIADETSPVVVLKELVAKLNREQTKTQDLLSSLGFALRSFTNLNQFLELVPLMASRVTDADGGALIIFRSNGQMRLERLHCSDETSCQDLRRVLEESVQGLSFEQGQRVETAQLMNFLDDRLSQRLNPDIQIFGTAVLSKNLERGRLYVFSYSPDYTWTDARQKLVRLVADQTAVAIENDELTAELRQKEVIINIGYKSEGVIQANEFRYNPDLKVGDIVDVYVETQEDKTGQLVVSHKTARMHSAWIRVNDVLRSGEIITGFVKCRTKGGLIVDVFGIEAFLPGSQIDVKPIRDYDVYVGKNMEFKVVKINEEFRNVVVSHKALIEAEIEEQKKQIISGLEKGQVLEGIVKNITTYGVFIDLGGVDGLIHITDLSWGRVNHPEELLELDSKINVVILDFDDDKKRIALGLKQLQPHPWDSLDTSLNVGDKVSGKVVVLADYGAFIEIAPGVEGLIHVSEMSWSQHLRSAQDFLKVGDTVESVVLTLDRDERKMSLGIKQLMPDPWSGIEDRYPVDSKHNAKVRNFTNFGVFVELEEGVDGLIHISESLHPELGELHFSLPAPQWELLLWLIQVHKQ